MHIPDGYLSPATCTALYATSAPFWYVALQRVKKTLHTRLIPLLSLFAAFSFVIMMFNLPLPGGTTGHAVGIGLAAVVLGPWAAMLAVSVAIVIQALFFGDGGITAIGANCFNMAVVGALVSYAVYRLLAGRSPIQSFRRVVAAGLAGYAAINVSALFAAIEFGIQPLLYHDAGGAPLYCPYPLSVAIPAMMLGHLTIAGVAELIVSAGVVAFLQKSDPSLLQIHRRARNVSLGMPLRRSRRQSRRRAIAPSSVARPRLAHDTHATRHSRRWLGLGRMDGVRFLQSRGPRAHCRGFLRVARAVARARRPRPPFLPLDRPLRRLRPALHRQRRVRLPALGHVRRRDHCARVSRPTPLPPRSRARNERLPPAFRAAAWFRTPSKASTSPWSARSTRKTPEHSRRAACSASIRASRSPAFSL